MRHPIPNTRYFQKRDQDQARAKTNKSLVSASRQRTANRKDALPPSKTGTDFANLSTFTVALASAAVEIACSRPSIAATNHHTSEASAESKKIRCCRTNLTSLRAHNCGTVPSSQELAKLSRPLRPLLRERHRSKKGISSPAAAGFVHGIGILCIAPNPPISASSQDDAP